MVERLKQIWSGFEAKTTRRLTGRGVDNIVVPHRQDWRAEEAAKLAEGLRPPAEAAFAALKARLAAAEQRAERKRRRKGRPAPAEFAAAPPPPLSAEAADEGAPEAARDLIRGLRATEARLRRRESDYVAVMSGEAGRALESLKKRKKFLGLF
ncbi:hypothetical protein [Amphiplicatus metriothermophilus]|uniref:Uncharacterized protein n=1 Tax=Amphiplicatus metriothermophilus TaxID=1519374 RepID=A0A239PJJ0_9PROT|nr:hypothetical protein [Amphiplicatus metriothermophilus]MBB5517708.1 hypothetical protein [Amphiplicatus metriothermophilus]SNT67958.1 hypothetical protein SAMN06297382_0453 [Amphiplicatus metriothermophilus]